MYMLLICGVSAIVTLQSSAKFSIFKKRSTFSKVLCLAGDSVPTREGRGKSRGF